MFMVVIMKIERPKCEFVGREKIWQEEAGVQEFEIVENV